MEQVSLLLSGAFHVQHHWQKNPHWLHGQALIQVCALGRNRELGEGGGGGRELGWWSGGWDRGGIE